MVKQNLEQTIIKLFHFLTLFNPQKIVKHKFYLFKSNANKLGK